MRPNRGIAGCPLSKDVLMLDPEVLFPNSNRTLSIDGR
jgi:hypothetical protein